MHIGDEKRVLVLHGSPPFQPRREGGRGRRRTGGLGPEAVPTVHVTRRAAQVSRSRVFRFFLVHFVGHFGATVTAIRVAHNEFSIRVNP